MTTTLTRPTTAPGPGDAAAPRTPTPPTAPTQSSRIAGATTTRHWVPKHDGDIDPAGHLSPEQIDELGRELDALREEILASRGADDAAYIRRIIRIQRTLEASSRVVLLFSLHPGAWIVHGHNGGVLPGLRKVEPVVQQRIR